MSREAKITAATWQRFFKSALLWLLPALLLLPVYLVLVLLSAIIEDGVLLEATSGIRGGINAALGPLLITCGIAGTGFVMVVGTVAEDYIFGVLFGVLCTGLGVVLSQRALRRLDRG